MMKQHRPTSSPEHQGSPDHRTDGRAPEERGPRHEAQEQEGNAAIAANLDASEEAGEELPGVLGVAGRGCDLDAATASLVEALDQGDEQAIRQALADVEAALAVAEEDEDSEAIKRGGRILYANRKKHRPEDTDEQYVELLVRFSKHRTERKVKEAVENLPPAIDEERANNLSGLAKKHRDRIAFLLDQRAQHSAKWLAQRGGQWTWQLSEQYITDYPYTEAEIAATKLADDHDNSVYFPDSDDDRITKIWASPTIRYVSSEEWEKRFEKNHRNYSEEEIREARAKNAAVDRKYGLDGMGGGMMSESISVDSAD